MLRPESARSAETAALLPDLHDDDPTLPGRRDRQLLCFSHLRWDFVVQRPQHLMRRFAVDREVIFFEEPIVDGRGPELEVRARDGVMVVTPHLPHGLDGTAAETAQRLLLDGFCQERKLRAPILWYYTPMAWGFSHHLDAAAVIYDCMDELSAFRFAPPALIERERLLLKRADLVFTGGFSLYEAKCGLHHSVHPFPSSVDVAHFSTARGGGEEPEDQAGIAHPRLGFCGVVDERMDLELLDKLAASRPDWQLVIVGPVVKIDPADLPRRPNIHYLGSKQYANLPRYFAGWDVALMPFARNESTRFISPTKTPEYLAAGLPVVSTPITDVVRHYSDLEAVAIADGPEAFVAAADKALQLGRLAPSWLAPVDELLAENSWDATWGRMAGLIEGAIARKSPPRPLRRPTLALAASDGKLMSRLPRGRDRGFDYLIVGAGFAGSVLAERLAVGSNKRVLLVDRRPHIAGNAYDCYDAAGIMVHRYGPHIFHTNAKPVADYLGRFTAWRPYEHRVLAATAGMLVPMPINRTTINQLYNLSLSPAEVEAFLASRAEPVADVRTSEDVVVGAIGRELYELFFRGYTRKMWGLDPSELDRSVTARVPTRSSDDDRYFTDKFQMMPVHGYTRMFENMLDHPNIKLMLNTDFREAADEIEFDHLVFTGPIDEFFDYRYGALPYRSLEFLHKTLDEPQAQPVAVVNYPAEDVAYTRITEYKQLTGQTHAKTSISYEFPSAEGDPYYPVPRPENQALFKRYQALADAQADVTFVGRLASYRYYNMDQVVAQALATYERLRNPRSAVQATTATVGAQA